MHGHHPARDPLHYWHGHAVANEAVLRRVAETEVVEEIIRQSLESQTLKSKRGQATNA